MFVRFQNIIAKLSNVRFILIILLVWITLGSEAQFYNGSQLTFGKSRVQYANYFWTYYRYDKFDVYFYTGGKNYANYTAGYVLKNLKEIENKFEVELEDKLQFVVFNSLNDFKQSNIGYVSDESYNTGGITRINGNKVFLYFQGSYSDFEKQIRGGIASVVYNQMTYGTTLPSQIKNTALFNLPPWYQEGLISYISEDWSSDIDNKVRDGILSGRYKDFYRLSGEDAIYAGHSFWKFIEEEYGASMVSNIVYMSRMSRSIENGFVYVLGMNYKEVIARWLEFYQNKYIDDEANRRKQETKPLIRKIKNQRIYQRLRLSSDGKHAAWISNESGQVKIWLYDAERNKARRIMKFGHRLDDKTDYSYPVIAWHPMGEILAIVTEEKGMLYLLLYNINERKFDKILLQYVNKVLDISYSHNGLLMAMSAVQNGQSDIYIYNLSSRTFQQITKDMFDDANPRFINQSRQLIFSSNRITDTIQFADEVEARKLNKNHDIFIYDLAKKSNILQRVTNTEKVDERYPSEYQKNYLSFLSDENGISNRYLARVDSTIAFIDTAVHYRYFTTSFPVTDYNRGLSEQDISPRAGKIGEIFYSKGGYQMVLTDLLQANELKKLTLKNTAYRDSLIKMIPLPVPQKPSEIIKPLEKDSTGNIPKRKLYNLHWKDIIVVKDSTKGNNEEITVLSRRQSIIKIGDFDKEEAERLKDTVFKPVKARNYDVEYYLDEVTSQVDFSFLNANYQQFSGGGTPIYLNPGFNALIKFGLTDLLEDYRIVGGIRFSFNFDNTEYLVSFENLKKRLDHQIILHRQSIDNYSYYYTSKQLTHQAIYILRYPFSPVFSSRLTGTFRYDREIFQSTDLITLKEPDIQNYWASMKGELVYDNTRSLGLNLFLGTRSKVWGEYYQKLNDNQGNLVVVGFDYRNYQRIHRSFIWANRFAASSSFGKNKLIYYLGGVDTWLFPKFNNDIGIDYSQNYAFQTLATNMRGFTQNIRNGNNFAVINSELRFPVFKYFSRRPIRSDFLNNFQIVGFGDLGTAWNGWDPWSKDNAFYRKIISGNPVTIILEKELNPIVAGYGFGLRSRLLGYFMRADWAWGVENGKIGESVFYFSLCLDF